MITWLALLAGSVHSNSGFLESGQGTEVSQGAPVTTQVARLSSEYAVTFTDSPC